MVSNVKSAIFYASTSVSHAIYTLSLHDALPICGHTKAAPPGGCGRAAGAPSRAGGGGGHPHGQHRGAHGDGRRRHRSEEHTSELQSRQYLVCRLLLEKKNDSQPNGQTTHNSSID